MHRPKANEKRKIQEKIELALHEMKLGTLRSGKSNKKVTRKKQALAIGFSKARREGLRAPAKRNSRPLQSKIAKKAKS